MRLRPAESEDVPAIQAIYAHHVLHGLGTFEEVPPSPAEMAERCAAVLDRGLPWLAAEDGGEIVGYAYAGPFRTRAAYRFTVEDSVYVAEAARGKGVGRALLTAIIAECEAMGLRQMVGVIGDSDNAASIALHRACGFELKAIVPAVGWKHGRWVDVVWMQRALGPGASTPPDGPGISGMGA
ncbi:MAG TPA: GNAT family N-acetyltransferase [Caulobacteraceae bacterium]|nr:GNAT family N-acetyltransferase [Caulobacteraceae bacterium]